MSTPIATALKLRILFVDDEPHLREIMKAELPRLGCEVTASSVLELKPDAVIVATGSAPRLPALADEDGRLVSAHAALAGARPAKLLALLKHPLLRLGSTPASLASAIAALAKSYVPK